MKSSRGKRTRWLWWLWLLVVFLLPYTPLISAYGDTRTIAGFPAQLTIWLSLTLVLAASISAFAMFGWDDD